MSKFEYPRFSSADIIRYLSDAKIAVVSEADLQNINPDFILNLYTQILIHLDSLQYFSPPSETLTPYLFIHSTISRVSEAVSHSVLSGIRREDYGQADFAALEQLENPDLHVDSVRTMNLFRKIKEVLAALECPRKFCLKDLIKPDADRTEVFLSAILNFCIHRETKMNLIRPMVEDVTLLDEQRQELEDRISKLNAEISKHNESREEEMPLVLDVDAKVKELRQTIPSLNNHQMSLKASIRKMKDKAKEMDEKISSAEFALVQSVQENAILRSKIVQSPDKLQRALEEKKLVRVEAKNAEREAMQSFQEKTAVHEVYTKACKKLSKNLTQIQGIQEQVNSAKSIEKDVKVLKVKLSDDAMLDKSLEAKLFELQGRVGHLEEVRKQLERERDLKCEEATKELNIVKSEVESKRHDLESRQTKVEAMVAEAPAITMKINSVKESGAAKRQELGRKCEEVVREFYNYSNSLGSLLVAENSSNEGANPPASS